MLIKQNNMVTFILALIESILCDLLLKKNIVIKINSSEYESFAVWIIKYTIVLVWALSIDVLKRQYFLLCAIEYNWKNWLFSAHPKGAEASAAIYSIIETVKANE